ncbi:MAG: glycerophosphodiester phosphodiesterase [Calditrichaeota bacterium]|nr:glycerophosphodiester phosphodiesterase [Calditrichota bacterium]
MDKQPLIITHRGRADHNLPENTIDACELALQQGANALEVDVRFCGSGELVVFHDLMTKRMTNKNGLLFSTSLSELKKLRLNPQNEKPLYVPTLTEFIEHFKNTVPINLDAKVFTPIAGQFAKYIVRAVKSSGYREQFWISSFNPIFLRTVKYCGEDIKTGYLFEKYDIFRKISEPFFFADYWHPEINIVNDTFIKIAQENDKKLFVWTVNEQSEISRLNNYDAVKGIITDFPHEISKYIDQNPNK